MRSVAQALAAAPTEAAPVGDHPRPSEAHQQVAPQPRAALPHLWAAVHLAGRAELRREVTSQQVAEQREEQLQAEPQRVALQPEAKRLPAAQQREVPAMQVAQQPEAKRPPAAQLRLVPQPAERPLRQEVPARRVARSTTGGNAAGGGTGTAKSAGCGKTSTLTFGSVPNESASAASGSGNGVGFGTGGYLTIQSSGQTRGFAMRLPDNYNPNTPYWLIFGFHWNGGNSAQVDNGGTSGYDWSYYGLQKASKNGAIFVAPDGLNAGWANSGGHDLTFTDDMVKLIEDNYCVEHDAHHLDGFQLRRRHELRNRVCPREGLPRGRDLRRSAAQRVRRRQRPHRILADGRHRRHHMY